MARHNLNYSVFALSAEEMRNIEWALTTIANTINEIGIKNNPRQKSSNYDINDHCLILTIGSARTIKQSIVEMKLFSDEQGEENEQKEWILMATNGEAVIPQPEQEIWFEIPDGMSYEHIVHLMTLRISQVLLCHKYVERIDIKKMPGLATGSRIYIKLLL